MWRENYHLLSEGRCGQASPAWGHHGDLRSDHGGPPTPVDPAALVGFRQLGHRFKVFSQRGVPRDPFEKVADAAQVHRQTGLAPSVACTSPGIWSTTSTSSVGTPKGSGCGSGRSIRTRSRTMTTNWAVFATSTAGPRQGDPPRARVHRHHGRDGESGPEGLASGRIELSGPGRSARAARSAGGVAGSGLRPARGGSASGSRVQVVRAGVLRDRRAGLGYIATFTAPHSAKRAVVCLDCAAITPRDQHRVHRHAAAPARRLGAFDFNSRFYADDDLMVGAVDPFQLFRILCEVAKAVASTGGLPSASCSISVTTSRQRFPVRSGRRQRPGDAGLLAAGRSEALAAAERAGDVLTGNGVLMDAFYTDVRASWRIGGPPEVFPPIPSRRTSSPGTPIESLPSVLAAPRPGRGV